MTTFKIGLVKHYFDKIGVCVVNLTGSVSVGDRIKFTRGGEDMFEQKVTSLQSEHKQLPEAKKGDTVGIKVDSPVKEGAEVYKV